MFYQSQPLQGDRKPGKKKKDKKKNPTMNSINMGSLLHVIYCEINSLIRVNAGWNTRTVDGAFSKSTVNSLGRRIRNPYPDAYLMRKKHYPFHDGSCPS